MVRYLELTPVNASGFMPPGRDLPPEAFVTCRCGAKRTSSCWLWMPSRLVFPRQETYGLSQQLRRAAVSIPANIAEGFRRRGKADKARFMNLAEGSLEECRYYLILCTTSATMTPVDSQPCLKR